MSLPQGWTGAGAGDFFRDLAGVRAAALPALGDATGWFLDAPAEVPFDRATTLPAVLARRLSLAEDAATNWPREATLVAARLEDGAVYVADVFPAYDLPVLAPQGDPLPDDGARVASAEALDLRARLPDLPWREGTLAVTALVGARRTATVTVRLRRATPYPPDVSRLLDARRAVGFPRAVSPPRGAPGEPPLYRAGQHTPRVSGAGLALHAVGATPRELTLWGALRAVPRAREVVRPDDPAEGRYNALRGASWVDVGAPGATAVMPVTLIARHPMLPGAAAVALQVPSYTELRAGAIADAFFGVAPFVSGWIPPWPGRWTFWAAAGERLAGPVTADVG